MTIAASTLANLIDRALIGPTGHAPGHADLAIFQAAQPGGERLLLVESDREGYPLVDEKWDAIRYPDGSLLASTYVRGREQTHFWKALDSLSGFEIWSKP